MIIALDFDGSCVVHEYPEVGRDIGALPVIEKLVKAGHHIMLWTMRSGKTLDDAVNWFEEKIFRCSVLIKTLINIHGHLHLNNMLISTLTMRH